MRKNPVLRAIIYLMVGLSCAAFNMFVYHQLLGVNTIAFIANVLAYLAASQPNFWLHDRKTFGDINTEVTGWFQRWREFMAGNIMGFCLNASAAAVLFFLLSETHAHVSALMISGLFNIIWNVTVPFRDRNRAQCPSHLPSPSSPVVSVEH